jgi:DNA-binding NtrC family response regulator
MPDPRPLNAIVCDVDSWNRRVLAQLVEEAGFEILAETSHSIEALHMSKVVHPSLVVILNEQDGLSGIEALPDFLAADPSPEVLLVTGDTSLREQAKQRGAFDITLRGDLDMTMRLLNEVRELLETGERRVSGDRRSGNERRQTQDWSKVTTERRVRQRRAGSRREQDLAAPATPTEPTE